MSRNSVRAVWPTDGAAKSSGRGRVVVLIVDESLKTRALPGSILSSLGVGTVVRWLHQLTGQGHAPGDDYLELLGVYLDTIRAVLSAE